MTALKSIRFATLNLLNYAAPPYSFYQLHERYNATQWRQKQQFIARFLQQSQATVVAFQEVFSPKQLEVVCKEQGYDYFATVASPRSDNLYPQVLFNPVVAIAAKYLLRRARNSLLVLNYSSTKIIKMNLNLTVHLLNATLIYQALVN